MKIVVGEFDTRREADRAMEQLVVEYGLDRQGIILASNGSEPDGEPVTGGAMPAISIETDDEIAQLVRNILVTAGAAHAHVR